MKSIEPVTLEYHELFRYQEITEAAIFLILMYQTIDRSAHDWEKLQRAMDKLTKTVFEQEYHQHGEDIIIHERLG